MYGDEISAIVVDVGSTNTKAGYAGEDSPKAVIPSAVGASYSYGSPQVIGSGISAVGEDPEENMESDSPLTQAHKKKQFYIGTNSLSFRRDFTDIVYPLEYGLVSDWEVMEQLWNHVFYTCLRIDPREHPILVGEASYNTKSLRERITELIFEKYQPPALFLSKNAVLSAFASGRGTAMVLDSGGGMTVAVPVHEGYALQKGIVKSAMAGERLTAEWTALLMKRGIPIRPMYSISKKELSSGQFQVTETHYPNTSPSYIHFARTNIIRDLKESVCKVDETPFNERSDMNVASVPYELPDGTVLEVGTDRFAIPELMFRPSLLMTLEQQRGTTSTAGPSPTSSTFTPTLTSTAPWTPNLPAIGSTWLPNIGVHEMIKNSISSCDSDIRKELFNSLIVTGGNSLLPRFVERLQRDLLGFSQKLKIIPTNFPAERKYSVWLGGSILASLGSFHQMWMSKAEYEENGRSLVERKCP